MIQSYIRSTGFFVPPRVVTNHDLEKLVDTTDEWIQQRSGIRERRWIEPGESSGGMAKKASLMALERASLVADDLDAIVFGCIISDYVFPGGGVLLQRDLGCRKPIPAIDIRNQCSAFLYSLSIADAWIRSGMYKRVLIVGSEVQSTSMDISTRGRDIAILFGDGAGAVILESTEFATPEIKTARSQVIDTILASEGENAEKLFVRSPSPMDFPRMKEKFDTEVFPYMDGRFVFKNAVTRMCQSVTQLLEKHKMKTTDVDFVIAHQANMRINQMVMQQLGLPEEKTHHTVDRYGNTTAATIPITLNEALELGKIKRGDRVIFVAFGSGFTWGASLVTF